MACLWDLAWQADHSSAKVYVILGDGELQEGVTWEAIMTAPFFGVDHLVAILDCNQIQKMDYVEKIIGSPNWKAKFSSFGWDVQETDGHDIGAFTRCVQQDNRSKKPRLIIANTIKGKGVSIMENNPNWHFKLPGKKELKVFKEELGISDEELE